MNEGVLVWGLVFGSIGLFNFLYGKKVGNLVIRYTGVALMVYPYFFFQHHCHCGGRGWLNVSAHVRQSMIAASRFLNSRIITL